MNYKFELVEACVNHAHFLKHSLPVNIRRFDNVVIVTSPTDYETQKVASDNGASLVMTDLFYKDGAPFNRGLAVNEGFKALKYNDWVVHGDADVVFPRGYEQVFSSSNPHLNKEVLYGSKRIEFKDYEEYADALREVALFNSLSGKGELIDEPSHIACGFFQMFNMQSDVVDYLKEREFIFTPEFREYLKNTEGQVEFSEVAKAKGDLYSSYPHCGGSDVMFRAQWSPTALVDAAIGEKLGRSDRTPNCNVVEIALPVWHLGKERSHNGSKIFKF